MQYTNNCFCQIITLGAQVKPIYSIYHSIMHQRLPLKNTQNDYLNGTMLVSGAILGSRRKEQGFSTSLPTHPMSKLPPCWMVSHNTHAYGGVRCAFYASSMSRHETQDVTVLLSTQQIRWHDTVRNYKKPAIWRAKRSPFRHRPFLWLFQFPARYV